MPNSKFKKFLAFACLSLLLAHFPAQGKLYRWYDEEGNIFYSDKVPPKHSKHKRDSLNNSGRVIDSIDAPKTAEQLELEKRLEKLRKEQERTIAKQKSHDRVLISTFRSEKDMKLSLKRKLQAIDSRQKVAEGNQQRMEQQLMSQHKEAAAHERNGKKVPQKLLDKIKATNLQLEQAKLNIATQIKSREETNTAFQSDLERFRFLTQPHLVNEEKTDDTAEIRAANLLGLFACQNTVECTEAWSITRSFIENYSTTSIELESDELIMTKKPITDQDISLSASRMIKKGQKTQIFLDIRCRKSSLGEAICASAKTNEIRSAFRSFIVSRLSSH